MAVVKRLEATSIPTILLAEDESGIRDLVTEFLTDAGYYVLTAADGKEALRLLGEHPEIALLFTDIRLAGGTTGFSLAWQARARNPSLKVIYATGHICAADWPGRRLLLGALLMKPFRLSDLRCHIEIALRG